MKRRIQGLVSSTSGKSAKQRSWKEESKNSTDRGHQQPDNESDEDEAEEAGERPTPPPAAAQPRPPDSDEEAWMALEEAAEDKPPTGPNPVVWMDLSVASKLRGRVYFELFRDVCPRTAENFRKLCLGAPEDVGQQDGPKFGYKGTELYKIMAGRSAEGGEFDRAADGKELKDENFKLPHTKGGLLSMANDGPHTNTSRFQVTFRPLPMLDGKQVVFGQVVADPAEASSERLHPLHWAGAMGTTSGTPLEPVIVEDCGECDEVVASRLRGPLRQSDDAPDPASTRYARAGVHIGQLEDAISRETVVDMLELTEVVVEGLEWQAKKAERSTDGRERARKAGEVEAGCKALRSVLEDIEFKAGDVQGADGKQSRKAKTQIFRVRDLEESLAKIY